MTASIEDRAVYWAAYHGHRWEHMNEGEREHYRRLVRYDDERRAAEPPRQPPTMPPLFKSF